MPFPHRLPALLLVLSFCSTLAGCMMAAHSIMAPMLDAGLNAAVERNATPENSGVSTSKWRGRDCATLKLLAEGFNKEKLNSRYDAAAARTLGWEADAIQQVRVEQGCDTSSQARPAVSAQAPMYGFCWHTDTDRDSRKHFVSGVFRYADWYTDFGTREQDQFNALLRSSHGQSGPSAICQGEDSQVKAEAARQKTLSMYPMARVSNINVAFAPTTPPPKPQAVTAAPPPGTAAAGGATRLVPAPTVTQGTLRTTFDAVTPAFAQSLAVPSAAGALVIETEKGSPAERAGLRPLDVVTEVGGQIVQTPADLQAIVGRMRPGYKAPLRVWRNKAMRDLVVEVSAGSPPSPAAAPTAAIAALAQVASPPVALPQTPAPPLTAYCYASSYPNPARGAVSRFFELPLKNGNYDDALMWEKLVEFHGALVVLKDSRFRPLETEVRHCGGGVCASYRGTGFFSTQQMTLVACKMDRAQSEAEWQKIANVHETVDWPKR